MVKIHDLPLRRRGGQFVLQPGALRGSAAGAVRLAAVAVDGEKVHRSPDEVVVALVARQREVVQVRSGPAGVPVMIAQAGEEAVGGRPCAVASCVGVDKAVVELADVRVNRRGRAVRIVVVADRDDEVGRPTLDQVGHVPLRGCAAAKVADHAEPRAAGLRARHGPSGQEEHQAQNDLDAWHSGWGLFHYYLTFDRVFGSGSRIANLARWLRIFHLIHNRD